MPSKPSTWWEAQAPSEEVANSLHPSLIEFLKRAWDEDVLSPYFRLFVFLGALKLPNNLRDQEATRHEWEDEEGRLVKLYESSHYRNADDEGVFFDQTTLKATFIEDTYDTRFITRQEWSWMPLEVILDSYLQMLDEEKAQVVSKDQAKLLKMDFLHGFMEPWIIHQYTKADLERATTAFKRLVRVIESRIPHRDDSTSIINLPWHDPATFEDQSVIPPSSFAHEFLRSISDYSVRFHYVAPGIRFPTVAEFQDQPITDFITSPHNHLGQYPGNCPLRFLQIDDAEYPQPVAHGKYLGLNNITAGFYISRVVETWPLFWSNGCRLLLPFAIGGLGWARLSNGEPFGLDDFEYMEEYPKPRNVHGDLYQAGTSNGITNRHPVQIDKVLNNWADRVERGDWEVNGDGVAGGIDKFREADTEAHWQKYWIPPSW
ncbi:uncharacterized protein LDX57_003189 [Aspergillus melleus]|uniref:uncharacterized protein n=1 Tax=Aspergillus melleus TaxID=138277 RepID=UPI001E8EEB13|nr:uncharacterized protein LDX57_003189 [Aspergillus melleus]KAH8425436.1 hypothetical protein LDX57_003189 [Aspergillus melleus]